MWDNIYLGGGKWQQWVAIWGTGAMLFWTQLRIRENLAGADQAVPALWLESITSPAHLILIPISFVTVPNFLSLSLDLFQQSSNYFIYSQVSFI